MVVVVRGVGVYCNLFWVWVNGVFVFKMGKYYMDFGGEMVSIDFL